MPQLQHLMEQARADPAYPRLKKSTQLIPRLILARLPNRVIESKDQTRACCHAGTGREESNGTVLAKEARRIQAPRAQHLIATAPGGISRYMSAPVRAAVMSTRRGGSSSIEVRLPRVILPRAPDVIAGGWPPQEFNLMFRVLAAVAANRPGRSSRRGTLHFPLPARPNNRLSSPTQESLRHHSSRRV